MARTQVTKFELALKFDCVIRGHHASKNLWMPVKGENLECRQDMHPDAQKADVNAIGIFKDNIPINPSCTPRSCNGDL